MEPLDRAAAHRNGHWNAYGASADEYGYAHLAAHVNGYAHSHRYVRTADAYGISDAYRDGIADPNTDPDAVQVPAAHR